MDLRLLLAVLRSLRALRQAEHQTRAQLEVHQAAALESLRAWAYARSPFYREFHHGLGEAPLAALPVLTKSAMMDHFDAFVTDREVHLSDLRTYLAEGRSDRFGGRYEVVSTSGSTGHPGIFLLDHQEWTTMMASFARAREWAGIRLNLAHRSRMAVVSSTNERNLSARMGKAADTPFIPTLRLDATQPLREIVTALNEWQPEVLVAYASMAYALSIEQANGAVSIHPRAVFTSSEVLTVQMREQLVETWGNVVFDEYASTETASVAAEDVRHHGLHLFEDLLIVENVDAQNQPVPPGDFGEKLLVTVLFSRTQPLIRYEISDSVRFAPEPPACELAFRTIDGVQGRREDVLILPGVNGPAIQVHPNVFHDMMDIVPNRGWQVIQEPSRLRVLLVPGAEVLDESEIRAQIEHGLRGQGVRAPTILIERVDAIPKATSGKTPLIRAHRDVALA